MPDISPILSLPYILPAQAQKHVTHNEALRLLDVMVQLAVLNRNLSATPALPAIGDRHIVAAGAVGAWAGQVGKIAVYTITGWQFFAPLQGWRAHVLAEGVTVVYAGLAWGLPSAPTSAAIFGVNTTADTTNRLAVQSAASLFSNVGAGHQVKVNKAAVGDTASLLFQSGFSGRAEMGIAGSDDFSVKVSANGSAFNTAMTVAAASGIVSLPQGVSSGGFALKDAGDATKVAQFSLSGLTTGVTRTYTLPNTTSEIAVLAGSQTFTGAKVFSGGLTSNAAAVLFNHAGAGMEATVNKAAVGDTASVVLKTGFSTRAQFGLIGTDATALRVSADGAVFSDVFSADAATGRMTIANPAILAGQASDPASPVNGMIWHNSTSGEVKVRAGGVSLVVGASGGVSDGDKGDITVSGAGTAWAIDAGAVTLAKMASVATGTILGRVTVATGVPEALTATQARTVLNVANGATANSADATLLARASHTGTQAVGTITGLATIATSGSAADLSLGTLPAARFDDTAHGARAGGTLHPDAVAAGASGFMSGADKTKLNAVAAGATANSSDAVLLARASHTGTQVASTISDFDAAVAANAAVVASTAKVTNATHTGDATGATALTLTTVNANVGGFGSATTIPTFIINAKGLTTAAADVAIAIPSTQVTDFIEAAQDAVGAMVNTSLVYTDATNLLQRAALSGDVTAAVGSNATTIANDAVTNAKLANMNAATIKGNNTGAAADPVDLTGTQTTAMLDTFTSALKGLVPASGGGTTTFLRADGTFAAPAGGGAAPGGVSGKVQFNNAAAFDGAANVEIETGNLKLVQAADPAAPANGMLVYANLTAGRALAKVRGASNQAYELQTALHGNSVFLVTPAINTTIPLATGGVLTASVTISHQQTIASANRWQATRRTRIQTAATAGTTSGIRTAYGQWFLGNAAGFGGFFFRAQFGMNINLAGGQKFVGLCASTAGLTTEASALLNMVGMGYDSTDASTGNWQFMRNDGTGVATKVDLGTGAARNTNDGYDLVMFAKPNTAEVFVRIINLHSGTVVLDTSYTTDIPAVNTALAFKCECRNGVVVAADNIEIAKCYIESDY